LRRGRERKGKRKRQEEEKRVVEKSLKNQEEPGILGAYLKLLLGLLLIEVRGLDFNHNLLVVIFSLILCISAYFG